MMKRFLKRSVCLVLVLLLTLGLFPGGLRAEAASSKLIAITFDDGPGPYTSRLLDGLAARDAKATFFTLGQNAEVYPDTIRRMVREGHQVCNHSYRHPELTALGVSGALNQLTSTDRVLNRIAGGSETYFLRAPYGSLNDSIRASIGRPEIFWSVDTLDWKYRDVSYVRNTVISQAYDGAIVLLHDIHSTSVDGFLAAIDTLKAQGYEMVTVREMFRRRGVAMYNGTRYFSCSSTGKDAGAPAVPKVSVDNSGGTGRVTLTTASQGAKIYYTTDGSPVGYQSKVYTGPFSVTAPCTIRALSAYSLNGGKGKEVVYEHTTPPAHPASIKIESGQMTLSGVPSGETVSYTLDGSDPRKNGKAYTGPVAVEPGTRISFYTHGEGKISTGVTRLYYSPNGNLFSDVWPENWYFSYMDDAASLGLLQGEGNYRYDPRGKLTRGMVVTILYRMAGSPEISERTNTFRDVKEKNYFSVPVEWAYKNGIVKGVSTVKFEPNRPVTRQELAQLLVKFYLQCPGVLPPKQDETILDFYPDKEDIAPWAAESICTATVLGLMQGDNLGTFKPCLDSNRAQGATVLCRLHQILTDKPDFVPGETPAPDETGSETGEETVE